VSTNVPEKIDPSTSREDLVKQAASSNFLPDFDWINDKEALRVSNDPANRGLTANEIRELAREWINKGGEIKCVPETRSPYCDRRHFHYDVIIKPLDGFPKGLLVYMELCQKGRDDPSVNLLNAHPPSF
jgi:hypothetical protein